MSSRANDMAAPARSQNSQYYYRESKLITSQSDSDSESAYEVPPELDSDSADSDSEARSDEQGIVVNSRSTSVPNTKSFVEDSLPNNSFSGMLPRPHPPARKSDSDGNLKAHLIQHDYKNKQTAMVEPIQQPEIPKHAQTRLADGRINLGKVLWYHGPMTRHTAEGLLLGCGEDGTYLLRDSSKDPNGFSLSVKSNNAVKHFQVSYENGQYHFGLVTFASLEQFLDHFDNQPLIGGEAGTIVVLKYPYFRDISEPDIYETPTVHTVVGPTDSQDAEIHNPIAIASKSGYLTKLGGRRKNWKRRWFVVFKNELQYFRKPNDKAPLRTINLNKALDIERYNSGPRENCFRLVCPDRTFYMYASSKAESDDWIKVIQWKMAHNIQRQSSRLKPSSCS